MDDIFNKIVYKHAELGFPDINACHMSYENFSNLQKKLMSLRLYGKDYGVQTINLYLVCGEVTIKPCASLTNEQIIFTRESEDIKRILHMNEFTNKMDKLIGE